MGSGEEYDQIAEMELRLSNVMGIEVRQGEEFCGEGEAGVGRGRSGGWGRGGQGRSGGCGGGLRE